MGWTFFNATGKPADILTREFTQIPSEQYPSEFKVIDQAMRGRTWYAVIQSTNQDGIVRVYGMVCLWTLRRGEFGYKEIAEECGPYQCEAPLRIVNLLDKHSTPSGYAAKWRQSVRDYHVRMKSKKDAKKRLKIDLNSTFKGV
jgi:hypothetical protein